MPKYYDLECQICHNQSSSDDTMITWSLNRPCCECGGPVRIVKTETEKVD